MEASFAIPVSALAAILAVAPAMPSCAVEAVDRTAMVDGEGVMRWSDDGGEVAVFGVNYYTPFALDYRVIGERGFDRKETIRRDVAHFRRLGLNGIRLHCFDREISTRDGALVDNDHLDLLDYLISVCASNGMYTVLTPIAAWGGGTWTKNTTGFATDVPMARLTTDRNLWKVMARFEEEFARHVNRYTGLRYADDPAVLCFELINEPAYTNKTPMAEVAEFANALLDGIRRSGTRKPVLYNATWNKRNGAVPDMKVDGVTGVYYVTGLRAGGALPGLQLGRVRESSLKADLRIAKMAKVVYEFDAADMTGAYMYPAMAAVFRAEGVQVAMQFQYDSTTIADSNESYKTHYLNLVYTPEKAISMAIAAEVFRRTPRAAPYRYDRMEVAFPPFRVNAPGNLSEMVIQDSLYYTASPKTPVSDPGKLRHVWGCGSSSVVSSDGSGAYFFDRVDDGLWRMQVYPNILPIADPYTGKPGKKTLVLPGKVTLRTTLPDLGAGFSVRTLGGDLVATASNGKFAVSPGDYILSREPVASAARLSRARCADIAPYCAPPPDPPCGLKAWPPSMQERAAKIRKAFPSAGKANLLAGKVRLRADNFVRQQFFNARSMVDFEALAEAFAGCGRMDAVIVSGKALAKRPEPVELAFSFADGSVWGTTVTFPEQGADIRIPVTELKHFGSWDLLPNPPAGYVPDVSKIVNVSIAIGLWLDNSARDVPHGVEISAIGCGVARASREEKQRDYDDTIWWDEYVENITDSDTYLRRKFRQDVTDRTTGADVNELKKMMDEIVAAGKASGESWRITKAKLFSVQVNRQAIDVSPLDWFPAIAVWDRRNRPINEMMKIDRAREINSKKLADGVVKEWYDGNAAGNWSMWQDFDHSVPDWRVIMKLGFPGMKRRLAEYAVKGDPFYDGLGIAMDAILSGIDRFIVQGKRNLGEWERMKGDESREKMAKGKERLEKEIACLERLKNGPPQTAYDMMMFVWLYFFYSEHLDAIQCRSLTELDVFLTPFYDADIAAGRTTEAEFREQLKHFLWQWGSVANYWNQPVGLGGTRKDGSSEFNHVSKIVLDVMDECNLATPKFLVKTAPNTPDWAWEKMLDMARRHRSISFIGEEPAAKSLKKWGKATDEDCRTMVMVGCYEFGLRDSVNGTGGGPVNLLKPIERMLADAASGKIGAGNGKWKEFGDFKAEYLRRLADVTDRCRNTAVELEKVLPDVNPANLMTLSTQHALKTRRDGFANGCPRGNTTSILSVGLGTSVDALMAVKEIVYEKKEMTVAELGKVMEANWKGHEPLRLRMLRSKRKWGNNDREANAIGAELIETFASRLNGWPNSRGGKFRASGHSARQFVILGSRTGATPDGRKKGDEMSKNLSPTMGADTEGATALVATLSVSDVTKLPGDYPLDVMLHPSACQGDKGLKLMRSLVETFHRNGGSVMQFTVFSAEELRDAQAHPEKYENLQVRVCGWNVRWNDLSKAEQDAYIRRAENVQK